MFLVIWYQHVLFLHVFHHFGHVGGSDGSLAVERGGWVAGWLDKLLFGDLAGGMAELLDGWLGGAGWFG